MGETMPELPSIVMQRLPEFVIGMVFVYAVVALLLTTLLMVARMIRVRSRLIDVSSQDELLAVFAQTGLQRCASRIFDLPRFEAPTVRGKIVLQSQFDFGRARQELTRFYRSRLARAQFFTALVVLVAIAGLGWLQDGAQLSIFGIVFTPWQAFVAIVALALLSLLGRLAMDAAAESLLDKISELPIERIESIFLHNVTAALESVTASFPGSVQSPLGELEPILERLTRTVETERGSLVVPIRQLSASAERLTEFTTAIAERPTGALEQASDTGFGEELKTAVERLTARIDWLSGVLAPRENAPIPNGSDNHSREPARAKPDLHKQLRDLLKDFK
jgi:hypothetical protein